MREFTLTSLVSWPDVVHLPPSFGTHFKCSLRESEGNSRNSIQWQVAGIGSDGGYVWWCENRAVSKRQKDPWLHLASAPPPLSNNLLWKPCRTHYWAMRWAIWSLDLAQSPRAPKRNGGKFIPWHHSWRRIPELFTLGILSKGYLCTQAEFTEPLSKSQALFDCFLSFEIRWSHKYLLEDFSEISCGISIQWTNSLSLRGWVYLHGHWRF